MPRDSGGTYTLPAGNPVATNTPIAISWANGTMSDIATVLTASLDRSGNGSMLAALKLFDGTVGAPGLTFGSETTSGLYRSAAGEVSVAISGAKVAEFNSTGLEVTGTFTPSGVVVLPVGAVGTPSLTFAGDTNLGIYRVGADQLGVAAAGVLKMTVQAANITLTVPFSQAVGTAAAPAYTFTGDTNTGMSAETADTLVLSTAGVARLTLSNAGGAVFEGPIRAPDGSVGAPGIAFSGDTDTGIFRSGTALIRFACDGAEVFRVGPTVINVITDIPVRFNSGSAATPSISFGSDTNTGFYWDTADEIGMSLGGVAYLVGYRNIPLNTQNGNYTAVLTDSGKAIYKASGGAGETITIPANATVAYPLGTVLTFINNGGGTLSIAITTDTLTWTQDGTTGTRTLRDNGTATAIKVATTEWFISGDLT